MKKIKLNLEVIHMIELDKSNKSYCLYILYMLKKVG